MLLWRHASSCCLGESFRFPLAFVCYLDLFVCLDTWCTGRGQGLVSGWLLWPGWVLYFLCVFHSGLVIMFTEMLACFESHCP